MSKWNLERDSVNSPKLGSIWFRVGSVALLPGTATLLAQQTRCILATYLFQLLSWQVWQGIHVQKVSRVTEQFIWREYNALITTLTGIVPRSLGTPQCSQCSQPSCLAFTSSLPGFGIGRESHASPKRKTNKRNKFCLLPKNTIFKTCLGAPRHLNFDSHNT